MTETAQTALHVKGLTKRFGETEVLKGIDLSANQGEVISLIGSSGSGKSTVLRCINLLETPTDGEIWVNGELIEMHTTRRGERVPTRQKQVEHIRQRLSMVFQSFNLWSHRTILENVIEGPIYVKGEDRKSATERGMALLEKVGITHRANAYPQHLSGGQQQRAAIARALCMQPEVMLFDEPTSALDPELVGEVLQVMHDLAAEGRTMLVVTHEMSFARDVSSQVLFLHHGKILEQGSPHKVFNHPETERCQQFLASAY